MMLFKQATIIGLGLIGGSLGKDLLKRKLAQRVIGYDVSKKHLKLLTAACVSNDKLSKKFTAVSFFFDSSFRALLQRPEAFSTQFWPT